MRTFTITQIKAHFTGVPYSYNPCFIGLLVKNKILVRMSPGQYAYDLNRLSADVIFLIIQEVKQKQLGYNRKNNGNNKKQFI